MVAKLSRKERELELRRNEVLDVALDLFVEKGFEQTSMAEIAQRAEFAVGTLYKLFADKNDLFNQLTIRGAGEFEQALNAAFDGPGDEVERIERYIRTKVSKLIERSAQAKLYFSLVSQSAIMPMVGMPQSIQGVQVRLLQRLEDTVRAGMRKKLIVKMDARLLTLGLEGLSNAYLVEVIETSGNVSEDAIVDAVMKILGERVFVPKNAS